MSNKPVISAERCPADHPCPLVRVCPAGAILQRGISLPVIEHDACIDCGACIPRCPMKAVIRP